MSTVVPLWRKIITAEPPMIGTPPSSDSDPMDVDPLERREIAARVRANLQRIQQERGEPNLSNTEIGRRMSVSVAQVGNILSGLSSTPFDNYIRLARSLSVDVVELFRLPSHDVSISLNHDPTGTIVAGEPTTRSPDAERRALRSTDPAAVAMYRFAQLIVDISAHLSAAAVRLVSDLEAGHRSDSDSGRRKSDRR